MVAHTFSSNTRAGGQGLGRGCKGRRISVYLRPARTVKALLNKETLKQTNKHEASKQKTTITTKTQRFLTGFGQYRYLRCRRLWALVGPGQTQDN